MMRHFLSSLVLLLLAGLATEASARDMAALEVNIGSAVDANVRDDIEAAVKAGVEGSGKFSYIAPGTARRKINPVARDCYTADCLKKAGDDTGADAGIRVRFSGEAQIYDWTIETYDLRTGKRVVSDKGACELCGRAEVQRTFQRSITAAATKTRISSGTASKPDPKPEPKPDPKPDTKPEPDPEPDVATPEPTPTTRNDGRTRLEISVQPTDAEVFLEGESLGTGDQAIDLGPGTYELRFAREGYQGFKESVLVGQDTSDVMTMRVHMSKTDPDPVIVQSGGGLVDKLDSSDRVVYGTIAAVAGGITLGLGLWAAAVDGSSACGEGSFEECPEIWDTEGLAITSSVVGTSLIIGGLALLTWELLAGGPEETEPESKDPTEEGGAEVDFSPAIGPEGVGLQLFGRF
jgi:hypothetical protein